MARQKRLKEMPIAEFFKLIGFEHKDGTSDYKEIGLSRQQYHNYVDTYGTAPLDLVLEMILLGRLPVEAAAKIMLKAPN